MARTVPSKADFDLAGSLGQRGSFHCATLQIMFINLCIMVTIMFLNENHDATCLIDNKHSLFTVLVTFHVFISFGIPHDIV